MSVIKYIDEKGNEVLPQRKLKPLIKADDFCKYNLREAPAFFCVLKMA